MSKLKLAAAGPLPEWQARTWLNTTVPLTLQSLRGRVVLVHAFQMLCPACVSHCLPQAERVHQTFPATEFAVVGLHTVFEHHDAMTVAALRAFVHEYGWSFPIGVDEPDERGGASITMRRYGLRGTPSILVLDQEGRVRLNHFGHLEDLALGALLGGLMAHSDASAARSERTPSTQGDCTPGGCAAP